MKIANFYHSVKINKVFCVTAIALISFFFTACASNHTATSVKDVEQSEKQTTISAEEIKQYSDKQQKWLSGLQEGLSPEDSLGQVFSYLKYFFLSSSTSRSFSTSAHPSNCNFSVSVRTPSRSNTAPSIFMVIDYTSENKKAVAKLNQNYRK